MEFINTQQFTSELDNLRSRSCTGATVTNGKEVQDGTPAYKTELKRERLEVEKGKFCDLVKYHVVDYGDVEFVENMEIHNADFRRIRSMMPFQYLDVQPSAFDWSLYGENLSVQKTQVNAFIVNYEEWKKRGYGLYIFSRTKGSGKTMLACCIVNALIQRRNVCVKFISIPDFLELTKKKYKGVVDKEEIDSVINAELLIIDDIGVEMKKEWIDTELFRLLDSRYNKKLVTIFTSNLPIEELKIDERIADRINARSIILKLPDVSIRGQQNEHDKKMFLSSVIEKAPEGAATPSQGNETR